MLDKKKNEFIELVQTHSGIIHKILGLYVDNQEDKKDLHQEILLQAWKSFKNFKRKSSFSTWLYKVSLNTVLTFNKKQKNNDEFNKFADVTTPAGQHEDHEVLYQIVRSLDDVDRMLISLHLEGFKNPEIAEITGMTTNHVNVKIHRIKNKVIENFKLINNG